LENWGSLSRRKSKMIERRWHLFQFKSFQWVQCSWAKSVGEQSARWLPQFSRCEALLLEFGSWVTGIVLEPRVRGTSAVRSRCKATASADSNILRTLVCMCHCRTEWCIKLSINPITNPYSVYKSRASKYVTIFLNYREQWGHSKFLSYIFIVFLSRYLHRATALRSAFPLLQFVLLCNASETKRPEPYSREGSATNFYSNVLHNVYL
jgi:hypothetical protein